MILIPCSVQAMPEGGDKSYMEWLYCEYRRLMYAMAWKFAREPEDACDIVSESCLRLIEKIQLLKTLETPQLKSYVCMTVRNTAITYLTRTDRGMIAMDLASEDSLPIIGCESPEEQIILQDELDRVWTAISQLPDMEQSIMRMKYDLGLSHNEIAERTGLSPNNVSKRICRARNHLKTRLYAAEKGSL
ncbi:MAG: sigma-70 family RNA polymerase sigma factor [Clostridia bacterium]|nr:sigma-70 family RNA polymerase sigma factor [Clostridia bacterium]